MRQPAEERLPGSSRTGRTAGLCAPEQFNNTVPGSKVTVFRIRDLRIRKCELGTDPGDQ